MGNKYNTSVPKYNTGVPKYNTVYPSIILVYLSIILVYPSIILVYPSIIQVYPSIILVYLNTILAYPSQLLVKQTTIGQIIVNIFHAVKIRPKTRATSILTIPAVLLVAPLHFSPMQWQSSPLALVF